MADSSVRTSDINCGLGMKETPKLRRNLGLRHKGCSTAFYVERAFIDHSWA